MVSIFSCTYHNCCYIEVAVADRSCTQVARTSRKPVRVPRCRTRLQPRRSQRHPRPPLRPCAVYGFVNTFHQLLSRIGEAKTTRQPRRGAMLLVLKTGVQIEPNVTTRCAIKFSTTFKCSVLMISRLVFVLTHSPHVHNLPARPLSSHSLIRNYPNCTPPPIALAQASNSYCLDMS